MTEFSKVFARLSIATLFVLSCAISSLAASGGPRYLVTNNDILNNTNTASVYTISSTGKLALKTVLQVGDQGVGGGNFGVNRVSIRQDKNGNCAYVSNAEFPTTQDIAGISLKTLKVTGHFHGSDADNGEDHGVGLVANEHYLYAAFTVTNTIATFRVLPGCKLKFLGDITTHPSQHGGTALNGMALHGSMLVVSYLFGVVESFNVSKGLPVSNGDQQITTGNATGNEPESVDITADGHFAIFADFQKNSSLNSTVVEVSDLSSGKLTATKVYKLGAGPGNASANLLLSPDESLLYVTNNIGGTITATPFDKAKGTFGKSCETKVLRGFVLFGNFLAGLANQTNTGTGGLVYVAEWGQPSSIGVVKVSKTKSGCTVVEAPESPVSDPNSQGLQSIGTFPPRSF
jgi:6-phosphogluconolactonase (cycloisomerase 2 family)